jgi:lipopolysaccharide export system permease protein
MILIRYVASSVVAYTFLALAMLVALVSFIGLVDDMGNIGKGTYTFADSVRFNMLLVPGHVYELLPPAALLGSLLGLGSLASGNEVVAMRAAGVSVRRVMLASLYGGLSLMLLGVTIGELLVPASEKRAQQLHTQAIRAQVSVRTESGYWARDGASYINFQDVLPGGVLRGVSIYEFDGALRLRAATHAETGLYVGDAWLLEQVEQSVIAGRQVQVRQLPKASWTSILTPEILNIVEIKPENLSARGLYRYIGYLEDNGLDSRRYRLALWQKVFRPVYLMVMLFLAVPFVLGQLRSVAVGQRILVGALLGLTFSIVVKMFGHAGLVWGFNPFASSLLPALLFGGGGVYAMRRVH